MIDLSVIIPARNEELLAKTVENILENIRGETEIIVVLDGATADPPLKLDPRITIIYNPQAKGQRAASNDAAQLARGKYLMKIDAHCAVDEGFDVKMLAAFKETGDNVTMIPGMKNLHAFDWVCPEGHRRYQGRSGPCLECGQPTTKDLVWFAKPSPWSTAFRFDKTMHFQYWRDWGYQQTGDITETMSIQGSCFMLTKDKWFELDICSEEFHSWGQQGVEVACKTWLSGGRVMVNRKTWYAHMFRTQGGDFGFPYSNPQSKVEENRELSRQLFQHNKWPKATRKFQWLLDHFNPPDWTVTKGIIYYTDNQLDESIAKPVRDQLLQISQEDHFPLVSSSLKKMDFGTKNIHFPSLERGYPAMFKQILGALENSSSDIIFFCEHDVLYHPSHFDFTPEDENIFYFNNNVWKVDLKTKKALKVDKCEQLSGMCVYRHTALTWCKEKLKQIESEGFDRHFEPQNSVRGGWLSKEPNVDIRHDSNLTPSRWSKDQFKNQDNTLGWTEGQSPQWASTLF